MGTRLAVAHHQLVVERPEMPKATLPIEDLGVVIVDDARVTYTQAVFLELLICLEKIVETKHEAVVNRTAAPARMDQASELLAQARDQTRTL